MAMTTTSLRLQRHREKRNADRPELQAALAKYDCDHDTYTTATARAKLIEPGSMYVDAHGVLRVVKPKEPAQFMPMGGDLVYQTSDDSNSDAASRTYEFSNINLTQQDWQILAHAALHDRDTMPILFAQIVSTATH